MNGPSPVPSPARRKSTLEDLLLGARFGEAPGFLAQRILADRLEHGKPAARPVTVAFATSR